MTTDELESARYMAEQQMDNRSPAVPVVLALIAEVDRLKQAHRLLTSPAMFPVLRFAYKNWGQDDMPEGADYGDVIDAYHYNLKATATGQKGGAT